MRPVPFLALVIGLASCANPDAAKIEPGSLDPDRPELNPRSSHWVEISGHIAAGYDLRVTAHYSTFNEECTRKTTTFGGGPQIMVLEEVSVQRVGETYVGKVQVDKWLPGRCQWFFYQVIYDLWPSDARLAQKPHWQWSEWMGSVAQTPTVQHTIECKGREMRGVPPNSCQFRGGGYFSPTRSVISKNTKTVVVNFE